jgi:hypothetical protein
MGGSASVFAATAIILVKPGTYQNTAAANSYLKRARQLLAAGEAMPGVFHDPDGAYKSRVCVPSCDWEPDGHQMHS